VFTFVTQIVRRIAITRELQASADYPLDPRKAMRLWLTALRRLDA